MGGRSSSTTLPPALVLTAGRGTRLEPLSSVRAKPTVPVAGVPLIVRLVGSLADQGVSHAVLNLHHRPDSITSLLGHGHRVGIPIRYSWETTLLGSAGGPRRARELLGPRFYIVNGDTLIDVDLCTLLQTHERAGSAVTMAISENPNPNRYGGLSLNPQGRVVGFVPPGHPSWHFVGIQLVESRVFDPLPTGQAASLVDDLYRGLTKAADLPIGTHRVTAPFREVGTAADYWRMSVDLARTQGPGAVSLGHRCDIHASAVLSRTVIWDDVTIGPECHLTDCIVTDGVRIPAGTTYERVIITRTGKTQSITPLETEDFDGARHHVER